MLMGFIRALILVRTKRYVLATAARGCSSRTWVLQLHVLVVKRALENTNTVQTVTIALAAALAPAVPAGMLALWRSVAAATFVEQPRHGADGTLSVVLTVEVNATYESKKMLDDTSCARKPRRKGPGVARW
jgi:hypothetical protein